MIGRALDSKNDLIIRNGSIKLVSDGAEVVQHVRSRLLSYTDEWFLDTKSGTPYFQDILIKPANLPNIESTIKTRILRTPGVKGLVEFLMEYSDRILTISFSAETEYGDIIKEEVTLNV